MTKKNIFIIEMFTFPIFAGFIFSVSTNWQTSTMSHNPIIPWFCFDIVSVIINYLFNIIFLIVLAYKGTFFLDIEKTDWKIFSLILWEQSFSLLSG